MRQIKMLAIAAAAAFALTGALAPSSFASAPPSGRAVHVTNAPAHITATDPQLVLTDSGLAGGLTCHVELTAEVAPGGEVHIPQVAYAPGDATCALIEPEELPWEGQICADGGGGGTLFVNFDWIFPLGAFAGWVEMPLIGGLGAAAGAAVESEIGEGTGASYTGEFEFSGILTGEEVEGEC